MSSCGTPAVGSGWGSCDPNEPRNRRLRASILVEEGGTRILVDTSPDLREQLLAAGIDRVDGVLYTHEHADHLHGIDELREVNRAMNGPLPIWASQRVLDIIGERFGYVLTPLPEGSVIYKPVLQAHRAEGRFTVGTIPVAAFEQDHGYGPSLGFRFGPVAYSTDVVEMPEDSFAALAGIDVWIVGCMTDSPHPTHAHVDKVLAWAERVRPKRTVLTHLGLHLDHRRLMARLPTNVEPAYDGMVIEA